MNNEADMLRRYVEEQSQDAFAEFVRQTIDFVYSAALRRLDGNTGAAADVAQRVFITAARDARVLTRHPSLTGWLYSTARNTALSVMRDQILRQQREREAHAEIARNAETGPDPQWERLRPVLGAAIDELSERDREAVLLRFFQERSFHEIGTRLQLTENGARMRVDRAVEKLHALLAKRGISSTTAALGIALANEVMVAAPATLANTVTRAALASATGSTLSILQLMSTAKILSGVAAVLTLLAIGFAGYNVRAQREAHAALTVAQRTHADLAARAGELERRVLTAEQTVAELQGAVSAAEAKAVEAKLTSAAPASDPEAVGKAFQERHPEIAAVMAEWNDARLSGFWGDFWKSRGLTPAQIDEFKSLFRHGQYRKNITSDGKGGQFMTASGVSGPELPRRMKALLGEDGFNQWFDLMTKKNANDYVYELARGLSFTENPLTPIQANRLSQPIVDEMLRRRFVNWDQVDAAAHQILSTEQLRVWKNVSAAGRAQMESRLAAQTAQKATAASSVPK